MDGHTSEPHSPPTLKVGRYPLDSSSNSTLRVPGPLKTLVDEVPESVAQASTRAPSEAPAAEKDDWEDNPENPRNWSTGKKWSTVLIVSLYTFISPLSSSIMSPGLPDVALKYGITSTTITAMTLSIFLLSFAIGPLFLAPLSEIYGRTWIYHIGAFLLMAFNFGCAYVPTTGSFIGLRFLCGLAGSAPIACGPGTVSDLFSEKDRAPAMAVYALGPLIGPVVGPIAGGYIAQTVGIKYVFVVVAGLAGLSTIFGVIFLRETYAPILWSKRTRGPIDLEEKRESKYDDPTSANSWLYLWTNLTRPVVLLFSSPICFILSLYMAFTYGIYYLMFATFPSLFHSKYGFSTGATGLAYIGVGIGFVTSTFCSKLGDNIYQRLVAKNGGVSKPEMRIPALFLGAISIPVGLFWYGWSADAGIHWIMPIIGSGIFGFGVMSTFLPLQLYLVDAFKYSASASAAAAFFRSLLGFAFPLFGQKMFDALGVGGGNSLLAGLAIVLGIPFPVWIYYKGEDMRARSSLMNR